MTEITENLRIKSNMLGFCNVYSMIYSFAIQMSSSYLYLGAFQKKYWNIR